jgi:hypothetical protein
MLFTAATKATAETDSYSTLQYETDDDSSNSDSNNPLKSAGRSFISASSKSLGMLFYNIGGMDHKEIQGLLLEAGTHLVNAGVAWSSNWNTVRECMYSASKSFYDISDVFGSANIDESLELGTLFERIGRELEDISNISGCTSIGPMCSSSNLLSVEECLVAISKILKKNSVASTDEHMMCTLFYEVAELFGEMGKRYVDDEGEGQKNEVSLWGWRRWGNEGGAKNISCSYDSLFLRFGNVFDVKEDYHVIHTFQDWVGNAEVQKDLGW